MSWFNASWQAIVADVRSFLHSAGPAILAFVYTTIVVYITRFVTKYNEQKAIVKNFTGIVEDEIKKRDREIAILTKQLEVLKSEYEKLRAVARFVEERSNRTSEQIREVLGGQKLRLVDARTAEVKHDMSRVQKSRR